MGRAECSQSVKGAYRQIKQGGNNLAKEDNLLPYTHKLTKEDCARGGKRSGEVRRLQGATRRALAANVSEEGLKALLDEFGIKRGERNYAVAIACALINKAARGDVQSAVYIRDTAGEKPKDEAIADSRVVIIDDLANKD